MPPTVHTFWHRCNSNGQGDLGLTGATGRDSSGHHRRTVGRAVTVGYPSEYLSRPFAWLTPGSLKVMASPHPLRSSALRLSGTGGLFSTD